MKRSKPKGSWDGLGGMVMDKDVGNDVERARGGMLGTFECPSLTAMRAGAKAGPQQVALFGQ